MALDADQADANADGSFDLRDPILVQRYLAGGWGIDMADSTDESRTDKRVCE